MKGSKCMANWIWLNCSCANSKQNKDILRLCYMLISHAIITPLSVYKVLAREYCEHIEWNCLQWGLCCATFCTLHHVAWLFKNIFQISFLFLGIMSARFSHSILADFMTLMKKMFLISTQLSVSITRWPKIDLPYQKHIYTNHSKTFSP